MTPDFFFVYQKQKFIAFSERFTEPDNWIMYYCIPSTVLDGEIQKILLSQLLFLLCIFAFVLLVFRIAINRFFSHPVNSIVEALEHSGRGNTLKLSSDMSGGIVEFETIIGAINSRDEEISNTAIRFQTLLDSMDAVVYVADMETYELIFVNSYGRQICGDAIGRKCYLALQQGQNQPCEFCTNHLLVDEEGGATGVHIWEFQNTLTGQWFECRDQAIRWTDGRLVRMEIATDISNKKMPKTNFRLRKSD